MINNVSDRQLLLESVKEEEKELLGTKELDHVEVSPGTSESTNLKKLSILPRPPHKKRTPLIIGRHTDRIKNSDKRRESENVIPHPCKIT